MFKKNSMEFFLGLDYYLYYFTVAVCYESPKQEKVSYAFKHLIQNLKVYNGVRI